MLLILSISGALAIGFLIGLIYGKNGQKSLQKALSEAQLEVTRQQTLLMAQHTQYDKELEMQKQNHVLLMRAEQEKADKQMEAMKAGFETERKALKEINEQCRRSRLSVRPPN